MFHFHKFICKYFHCVSYNILLNMSNNNLQTRNKSNKELDNLHTKNFRYTTHLHILIYIHRCLKYCKVNFKNSQYMSLNLINKIYILENIIHTTCHLNLSNNSQDISLHKYLSTWNRKCYNLYNLIQILCNCSKIHHNLDILKSANFWINCISIPGYKWDLFYYHIVHKNSSMLIKMSRRIN